jgi:hypothetical protein
MAQQGMTYDANAGMAGSPFATAARWLKVWVGICLLAVVIVCLFLISIILALKAIDRSLAVTDPTVTEIRGATDPLTAHIGKINGYLTNIDVALKPIPARADTIIGLLTDIDKQAAAVDGSLGQTSSILITGLSNLGTIGNTLRTANEAGVAKIIDQANVINGILTSIKSDTHLIDLDLSFNNGAASHVVIICQATKLLYGGSCGAAS